MKCPNCGSQMGLEDKFCPYCGSPNPFAKQHQRDMERYQREYEMTQEDVLTKTASLRRHGGQLVVVAILLVLLVVAVILNAAAWEIGYNIRTNQVNRAKPEDTVKLKEYLDDGEYGKFFGYYYANDISYGTDDEYAAVRAAAREYTDLIRSCWEIRNIPEYYGDRTWYESNGTYIADALIRLFTLEKEYNYYQEDYLSEDKMVYINDMRDRAKAMAMTYFKLTEEEVNEIPNVSKTRLADMIEERCIHAEE